MTSTSNGGSFSYDNNGNMTSRTENGVTYSQSFDAENRLQSVTVGAQTTTFTYDGDGARVKKTVSGGATTVYVGNYYEKTGNASTKYYYFNGQRVAMRRSGYPADNGLFFLHGDHLGSTSLLTNQGGSEVANSRVRYYPYGTDRPGSGNPPTDYRFTGQKLESTIGLYDYGARFYDPALGRFLSADTVVPQPGNPQALNRYAYVLNNPLRYTDPTGHYIFEEDPNDPKFLPATSSDPAMRYDPGVVVKEEEVGPVRRSGARESPSDPKWEKAHFDRRLQFATITGKKTKKFPSPESWYFDWETQSGAGYATTWSSDEFDPKREVAAGGYATPEGFYASLPMNVAGEPTLEGSPIAHYCLTCPGQPIYVEVTNPKTGKSVIARVVDRGPDVATGLAMDLTPGVKNALGLPSGYNNRSYVTFRLIPSRIMTRPDLPRGW